MRDQLSTNQCYTICQPAQNQCFSFVGSSLCLSFSWLTAYYYKGTYHCEQVACYSCMRHDVVYRLSEFVLLVIFVGFNNVKASVSRISGCLQFPVLYRGSFPSRHRSCMELYIFKLLKYHYRWQVRMQCHFLCWKIFQSLFMLLTITNIIMWYYYVSFRWNLFLKE